MPLKVKKRNVVGSVFKDYWERGVFALNIIVHLYYGERGYVNYPLTVPPPLLAVGVFYGGTRNFLGTKAVIFINFGQ